MTCQNCAYRILVSSNDTKTEPVTNCTGGILGDDFAVSGGAWSGEHTATERLPPQMRLGNLPRYFANHARSRDGASKGMPDRPLRGVWRNRWDSGLSVGFGSDDPELPSGDRLRLRERADLADVRIHDFRHVFASRALALGESLPMSGKLLGHTQVQTTARYAHLANESVKPSGSRVGDSIGTHIAPVEP